ncbi:MAG: ThuA domain-containing protein, partial [Chitinophagaceae bacterium]|nr:ThuA domain-containing protein [Chitinophagaceae bacterium]
MKRHDTLYSIFQIILWEGWRKRIKSIRIAAFSALLFLSHISCAQKTGTIHVLIVTGMDIEAHDWRKTTPAIREELEKDPRMQVDTLTDIYALSGYNLSPYDVVYLNFNNWKKPDPDKKAQRNLEQFVAKGGGLVVAHFASGSFEGWPEYAKLAGRVWDRMNTHDPRDPFRVEITDTSHPITKGMTSFDTDDELYICLTGEEPIHVLAQAKS